MSVIRLEDFSLSFRENERTLNAVSSIRMEINESEIVGLIGESGSGKSATALSMIGLEAENAVFSGHIYFEGKDLLEISEKEWERIRGERIAMIFQEPMTALNPLLRAGRQIEESLSCHKRGDKKERRDEVLAMLKSVGLGDVERIFKSYPHQLSGGQRQRIMIAMALINNPSLLIADEPTTALDVTIQAEIIDLIKRLNEKRKTAVLLISHNLSLVKGLTERTYIMYAGTIVESGRTDEILASPIHPYTRALLSARPHIGARGKRLYSIPGHVPSLAERKGSACAFAPRCCLACDACFNEEPEERDESAHRYSCIFSSSEIERRING